MKKVLFVIISLFFCINVYADTSVIDAKFSRCVDGDTAVFIVNDEEVKFRFLAIDTPESVKPNTEVQAFAKDASEYTCNALTNAKTIKIEQESKNKTDKYGRSLGWIWYDGKLLQSELIKVGYAEVAYIYGKYLYTESLCIDENDAFLKKVGIWSDENRERKYCSTVDIENANYNIDYSKFLDNKKNLNDNKKGYTASDVSNKVDNTLSFLENDKGEISNSVYYAIIIIAAVYIVVKAKKK